MAGFIRRYSVNPGTEVITQIEGAVIVDSAPPGAISGVQTGVVALVGEFADMGSGVSVDASGNVTTKPVPVEIFSAQDLATKLGGFDETIGEFGVSGGNGFTALRNKRFSRLIAVAVNLCSTKGVRVFRQLPTNKSATDPTPITPVQAAVVAAAREFKSGTNRVRLGTSVRFSSGAAYAQGTDGSVTVGAPAATRPFTSASGDFVNKGVKVGDLLVLGVIGGAAGLGANAGTYRVATVTSATVLDLEKMDGTAFDWTTTAALPWRLHAGAAGDSSPVTGMNLAAAGGATIPARPLDATVVGSTVLTPSVVPTAGTATTWDPLSGLQARTSPTTPAGDLVYTAAVQAPNAVSAAAIDALYSTAVDALLSDDPPGREANIIWAARTSATIRTKLKSHVLEASSRGLGRVTLISPEINQVTQSTVLGDADPGVGANRDERIVYGWPGAVTFVPEAVGFLLKTALGTSLSDGMLDDRLDGWIASVLSNLPPEQNPGQSGSPVSDVLAPIQGFQRGVSGLGLPDYIQFRQKGICALRLDRTDGPIFQSGITTSLTAGRKNIARRRMADYIEDSVAQRYNQFSKKLLTNQLKDAIVAETVAFLQDLLSPNNPPAQRISAFSVDSKAGNTPDTEAQGIFVVIGRVRTLASADFIVFQAEIGESVNVVTQ